MYLRACSISCPSDTSYSISSFTTHHLVFFACMSTMKCLLALITFEVVLSSVCGEVFFQAARV